MSPSDREALAEDHLDMVERIVAAMCRRFPAVERDDLRSFGMEGLAQAIDRWDPEKGASFSTYARNRITGSIYDGVQQSGRLPRRMLRRVAFYRKTDGLLDDASKAPPPLDKLEATHRLACRLREVATAYIASMAVDCGIEETIDQSELADELLGRHQYFVKIQKHIERLPSKQRDAIRLYFIEEQRLPTIAEQLGCNKSWVSRLIATGLERIRVSFVRELEEETHPTGATAPARSR